jgi:hypothetical protein
MSEIKVQKQKEKPPDKGNGICLNTDDEPFVATIELTKGSLPTPWT